MTRPRVLIVGAGFAGFHCARELERLLRPEEAELTLASPVDYMLYSPLLPQVAAGVITPQAVAVSLRRALRRTLRAPCSITGIDLDARACVAQAVTGEVHTVPWDYLVLCPGAVTRTFGTPGGEQHGRGMKTLAQATHPHDHVLAELELGNAVGDAQGRAAHCTFTVADAGYAGVETAAALHLFTRRLLPRFINLRPEHLHWMLADVAPHGLPELGGKLSAAALGRLRQRGIDVRLDTGIAEITASAVRLTDGTDLPCHTMVWTAGAMASPLIATLGLETARSGRLRVTPKLHVPGRPEVFGADDAAAVPDLTQGVIILIFPLGFRLTCYYYRKAYYRSWWLSPSACAVPEPRRRYTGETRFPLLGQNVHRYFFYAALAFNVILTWDAIAAFDFGGHIGIGVGTVVLVINAVLLWLYSLSCHACRHAVGGRINHFSKHPIRYKAWTFVSRLNPYHGNFAWLSLVWVALTDLYVRLMASGVIHDPRVF